MVIKTYGTCPICGKAKTLTKHHILKWTVFHNDEPENIIYLCKECHNQGKNCLEELIRERENELLRKHPELYTNALKDYFDGVRPNIVIRSRKRKKGGK